MGNCILILASDFSCILYYISLYSHASVCLGCTEKLSDTILLVDLRKPRKTTTTKPLNTLKKMISSKYFSRVVEIHQRLRMAFHSRRSAEIKELKNAGIEMWSLKYGTLSEN